MVPARVLTLALFSAAVVAVVWWRRPRTLERVATLRPVRHGPDYPWTDVS